MNYSEMTTSKLQGLYKRYIANFERWQSEHDKHNPKANYVETVNFYQAELMKIELELESRK